MKVSYQLHVQTALLLRKIPPPPYLTDGRLGGPHWMSPTDKNLTLPGIKPSHPFITYHENILTLDVHLVLEIHLLQIKMLF